MKRYTNFNYERIVYEKYNYKYKKGCKMIKKVALLSLVSISLYGGVTGCKYQEDLIKVNKVSNKIKFMIDNHCANVYSPAGWKQIKKDKIHTLIQSPHKGEEKYKYWVKTNELQKETKKAELEEKIKKEKMKERSKKHDFKTVMKYGDLMWQDSLINEIQKMSYTKANSYCKELNYKGSTNWRLPSINELRNICDIWGKNKPYKALKHIQISEYYWGNDGDTQFVFSTGATSRSLGYPAFVRCVTHR